MHDNTNSKQSDTATSTVQSLPTTLPRLRTKHRGRVYSRALRIAIADGDPYTVWIPKLSAADQTSTRQRLGLLFDDQHSLSTRKVLLLGGGLATQSDSIASYLVAAGMECSSFDAANGPLNDPADTYVYDKLVHDVKAGDYAAAIAVPYLTTFPDRLAAGKGIYGDTRDELVRYENLICTRVATLLNLLTDIKVPWIFECKATSNSRASVTNLEEFICC